MTLELFRLGEKDFWTRAQAAADREQSFSIVVDRPAAARVRAAYNAYRKYRQESGQGTYLSKAGRALRFWVAGLRAIDFSTICIYTEKYPREIALVESDQALEVHFIFRSKGSDGLPSGGVSGRILH